MSYLKTACMFLALCNAHGKFDKSAAALYAASQFDAATTYTALQSRTYAREVNPVFRPVANSPLEFPIMAAATWGELRLARYVKQRHKNLARSLILLGTGVHTAAGINNIKVATH